MIVISNVPLDQEVARERFRADLYHRLNVIEFRLTPLRERCDAIIPLVQMFLAHHPVARLRGISGIAPDAFRALEAYRWPGNIRELRNVVERAVTLGDDTNIRLADLPEAIRAGEGDGSGPGSSASLAPAARVASTYGKDEMRRISEALRKHRNNRVLAAIELRISRVTLYKKLRKYGFMPNGSVE
jgi:DNA-binding NtrC family response regulator